jgi:hypothetical protein
MNPVDTGMTFGAEGSALFHVAQPVSPPRWAALQVRLIEELKAAAPEFVKRYTREDGTLIWRDNWPGMDGSDDPYEAFMYLGLLYAVAGDEAVYELARSMWESITWQWTQYGQIDREFDRYYDWMHHGEGNLFHYFFGLCKPSSLKDRQRADRFASFYNGRDERAQNWDADHQLIRSAQSGSDGPRFVITAEDLSTHRAVLKDYLPPFEDMTTAPFDGRKCDWQDEEVFTEVLRLMNQRTTKGDVPLNLNATSQMTHAYLYDGDSRHIDWVLNYVSVWAARSAQNNGILPDNVGLTGQVGEYLGGKWWGGHYGWRWPHGFLTIIEPVLNSGMNAHLMSGDDRWLDLAREQLDANFALGVQEGGLLKTPHKHFDSGWADYRPADANHAIHLWARSQTTEDLERVLRVPRTWDWRLVKFPSVPFATKHYNANTHAWFEFARGNNAAYPEEILTANLKLVAQQLRRMRSDQGDPTRWPTTHHIDGYTDLPSLQTEGYAIHAWQEFCPVYLEGLVQTAWGAPLHISHGGLQYATVRYFDGTSRTPGLPNGVAALVSDIDHDSATVELVNTHPHASASVVLQAGAFGEHRFLSYSAQGAPRVEFEGSLRFVQVALPPQHAVTLKLGMLRNAGSPSYETPWSKREDWAPLIQGRTS